MDCLYIIIPAYNEAATIRAVVEEWYPVVEQHDGDGKSRLLIINDGSTDATADILEDCQIARPLLQVETKKNGGHGPAVLSGYRMALAQGADYIFQTDSDRQTIPEEFPAFWDLRKDYDGIFGIRAHRQDGKGRVFVSRVLRHVVHAVFGVWVPDANVPFRLMTAAYVGRFLPMMPRDYELPNVLLTALGAYYGERQKFLPITFRKRQGGVNSINAGKIIRTGRKTLTDFRKIRAGLEKPEGKR